MRGNESLEKFSFAGCVLSITDEDDRLTASLVSELFLTRQVNGVIQRCPAADLQVIDRCFQRSRTIGEVLYERDGSVKPDHHRKVIGFENRFQKAYSRFLLFFENRAHTWTGVDEHADRERQFVLSRKMQNLLPLTVL